MKDPPSKKEDPFSDKSEKKTDMDNGKNVNSRKSASARDTITCANCGKPRCLFSKYELTREEFFISYKSKRGRIL